MKTLIVAISMFIITGAQASIEHAESSYKDPTPQEIAKSRACFEEVAKHGCGDPGEEIKEFRSCLHDIFPKLTVDCKKMMTKLYSNKN